MNLDWNSGSAGTGAEPGGGQPWHHGWQAPAAAFSHACLAHVLDAIDSGVIVVDIRAQLLWANEAARRELRDGGVLCCLPDGALDVRGAASVAQLRAALLAAAAGGRRQLLPLRHGERLLMVAVQPLPTAPSDTPRALIVLGRRQLVPTLLVEMLSRLYELTPAECRVLMGLLAGQRVATLAREHRVKISTVRTQVAAIREKFGVRRIDDLTRIAAELPPIISALRTSLLS